MCSKNIITGGLAALAGGAFFGPGGALIAGGLSQSKNPFKAPKLDKPTQTATQASKSPSSDLFRARNKNRTGGLSGGGSTLLTSTAGASGGNLGQSTLLGQ